MNPVPGAPGDARPAGVGADGAGARAEPAAAPVARRSAGQNL